jgi:hypothetical protein
MASIADMLTAAEREALAALAELAAQEPPRPPVPPVLFIAPDEDDGQHRD